MAVAVSAVVAAIAAPTFLTITAAVSAVGLATTVVGAVTGDKGLVKIGGELGMVGGLGGAAAGAIGAFGAAEGVGAAVQGAGQSFSDAAFSATADAGASLAQGAAGTAGIVGDATGAALSAADAGANYGATGFDDTGFSAGANPSFDPTTAPNPQTYGGGAPAVQGSYQTQPGMGQYGQTDPTTQAPPSSIPGDPSGTGDILDSSSATNGTPYGSGVGYANNPASTPGNDFFSNLQKQWQGLDPATRQQFLKAGLAIPGGIQAQSNKDREFALQQQKVNQTSYGSRVPKFGIINRQAKG